MRLLALATVVLFAAAGFWLAVTAAPMTLAAITAPYLAVMMMVAFLLDPLSAEGIASWVLLLAGDVWLLAAVRAAALWRLRHV